MKKLISIIAILLVISLTACSGQIFPDNTESPDNSQGENITMLDEGVWPINAYTDGLPVPSGTVLWAILDSTHENCGIGINGISETESAAYIELLKREGFSVIEYTSEKVKGQNYVSVGTLLSDGKKGLSIAYTPYSFTIYISLESR